MDQKFDYIIVGARCAGAATAMLLARSGAKVLLVDRALKIGDTLSTHALMRPAIALLDQWGLLEEIKRQTPAVRGNHFYYDQEVVTVEIEPFGNADGLYAPRRYVLDALLLEAAAQAGAEVRLGMTYVGASFGPDRAVDGATFICPDGVTRTYGCRMLIGADGRMSKVAQSVRASTMRHAPDCGAVVFGYFPGIPNIGYRWFFSDALYGGLIPTCNDVHCAFLGTAPDRLKALLQRDRAGLLPDHIAIWEPGIAAQMAESGPVERLRQFAGAPGQVKTCAGKGWALVGDAGFFKDPCSGHGITDAFLDAHRLSQALSQTPYNAAAYARARNAACADVFDITQEIAALRWDMPRLMALHKAFSKVLKHEAEALAQPMSLVA